MFKFFKRMKTVVGSEMNAMLDKAEDPVKMLDQFMRDMSEDIKEAESAVAKQMAHEKMLKRKADDAQAVADKRAKQAEQAVESKDDDLARRALEDKQKHADQADQLNQTWLDAKEDTDALKKQLEEMKNEYEQMELKKDNLKTRAETAKAKTKLNRTMSSIGSEESKQGFERMEEKVLQYEAEAETSEDLKTEKRSLDDEFSKFDDRVDSELEQLKEQKQSHQKEQK